MGRPAAAQGAVRRPSPASLADASNTVARSNKKDVWRITYGALPLAWSIERSTLSEMGFTTVPRLALAAGRDALDRVEKSK